MYAVAIVDQNLQMVPGDQLALFDEDKKLWADYYGYGQWFKKSCNIPGTVLVTDHLPSDREGKNTLIISKKELLPKELCKSNLLVLIGEAETLELYLPFCQRLLLVKLPYTMETTTAEGGLKKFPNEIVEYMFQFDISYRLKHYCSVYNYFNKTF